MIFQSLVMILPRFFDFERLLLACAVVITLEKQKGRKKAPRFVEFNFLTNGDRQKRISQNERRRADLQRLAFIS